MHTFDSSLPQGLMIGADVPVQAAPATREANQAVTLSRLRPRFRVDREFLLLTCELACYGAIVTAAGYVMARALGWVAL